MNKKMPKSLKTFIRREKARIRRQVLDAGKQKQLIKELYIKTSKDNENK